MKIQLNIEVETPEDLTRVLQIMAAAKAGAAPAITTPAIGTVTVHDPEPTKPADPKPDGKKAGGGARKPKDETPAASGGPAPSPTTPSPSQSAPEQSAGGAPTQPEGAGAATSAAKKDPVPAAAGASAAATNLPDNVRNTTSMRDLLTYLSEHGVDSIDAMVATCQVLQKDVPILSKVPKLDERVRRACEVIQLFAAPEPEAEPAA